MVAEKNRDKLNSYYNDAIIDVLALKNDCYMTVDEIKNKTPYEIDLLFL